MARSLSFVCIDGREFEAASPREAIEAMRALEDHTPADLAHFLDVLQTRGELTLGILLDVGRRDQPLDERCRLALGSLIRHGWLCVKAAPRPATWPPPPRRPAATNKLETSAS